MTLAGRWKWASPYSRPVLLRCSIRSKLNAPALIEGRSLIIRPPTRGPRSRAPLVASAETMRSNRFGRGTERALAPEGGRRHEATPCSP